jgi:hypothetical protein
MRDIEQIAKVKAEIEAIEAALLLTKDLPERHRKTLEPFLSTLMGERCQVLQLLERGWLGKYALPPVPTIEHVEPPRQIPD